MALNPITILEDTINSVAHTIEIDSVTSLGGSEYKLFTENTLYLRTAGEPKFITIDSVDYTVTDFEINVFITVKAISGDVPVTVSSFTINPPTFVWGNPKMVSAEIVKRITNGTAVWPYMWIVEISNTQTTLDPSLAVRSTPSFNIFFLDSADKDNWTIEEHYDNDIYPLNNYIGFFTEILRSRRDLFDTDSITFNQVNHVNFGDYIVDKGNEEKILNDNVTGIQVQIDLPLTIDTCDDFTVTPNCVPCTESFNGSPITGIPSGGNKAIIVQNDASTPVQVGTILTDTATNLLISVPEGGGAGLNTANGYKTAQTTSTGTGSDGALQRGRGLDWFRLNFNNPFGNIAKLTGTTGGFFDDISSDYRNVNGVITTKILAFPGDLFCNWAYWNEGSTTFDMWYFNPQTGTGTTCKTIPDASSQAGFTDWACPNCDEQFLLSQKMLVGGQMVMVNYPPIDHDIVGGSTRLWTNTLSEAGRPYSLIENANMQGINIGNTALFFMIRTALLSDVGL